MAVILSVRAIAQYAHDVGLGQAELQLTRQLRYKLFSHLSALSPGFHARNKSGDLLVRLMGDVPLVSAMLVTSLLELGTRALLILSIVVVMVVVDPILAGATFLVTPIVLLLVHSISNRIHVAVRKQRTKEGDLADYLHEAISATETIQSVGGSNEVIRRFARNNRRSARAGLKAKKLAAKLSASVESLLGFGIAIVFALGSLRVLERELSTGELLVFLSYVRMLAKPVRSASKHTAKIAKGTACGERLLSIIDEVPEVGDGEQAEPAPSRPSVLEFHGVSYSYDGEEAALNSFSSVFRRGELSALVGRSGAGKSTLASLAARLMDPSQGHITLDGQPLGDLSLESVRGSVGLCLQKTILFGESIRENLLLGTPEATDEEVMEALRLAGAASFVERMPDGLETELGSSGVGFSGGELSRLSLARTLLRDAGVLIVDEPFAGLDREAASHLSATLRELAREKIVVVIAHDFENMEPYDHVVFLERGRNLGEGRHEELARRVPMYRDVVRAACG